MIHSVGLIGYGRFGAFLRVLQKRYAPELTLKIHSRRKVVDGLQTVSLEEVAACDALVLTVPISAYEATLERVVPHLGKETIIVDVATVKKHTGRLIQSMAPNHRFISTHPMFGPESYAKRGDDVTGLRIVVTENNLATDDYRSLLRRLTDLGFSLVETSPDAHDKDLAETLFLTHYVGQVIARGGFERTDIDTVSFGYLMDAVDSVRHDTELFQEVCRFNPYCARVIERFDASETEIRDELLEHLPAEGRRRNEP
jgi:prephenate dehydrogenase